MVPLGLYRSAYSQYLEFDTKPILTIEDALPHLLEAYQ